MRNSLCNSDVKCKSSLKIYSIVYLSSAVLRVRDQLLLAIEIYYPGVNANGVSAVITNIYGAIYACLNFFHISAFRIIIQYILSVIVDKAIGGFPFFFVPHKIITITR
jgi:membrane-bound ClpP family serine protease